MEREKVPLKRLGFARDIAITAAIYVSNLYLYAYQSSAAFRSASAAVETAVHPVYHNLKAVSGRILLTLDHKVDQGLNKLDEHAPPSAKWAIEKAQQMAQQTYLVAQIFVQKAQINGPSAAIRYCGHIFTRLVLILLANFWYLINQITALHVIAQMAIPTVAHWSETYNKTITEMVSKGYIFFNYLPYVPTEEITKAYKQVEDERGPICTICN